MKLKPGTKIDVTDKCQHRKKKVKQVQETQNEEKQKAEHEIQILDKKF